ncbi:MAG: hypothetical protein NTU48_02610 [Legionellales bacterium]|nr:hypothetical protein [Legionellales bacterium]
MDYSKFLRIIKKINYAKAETTREIQDILYTADKAEILNELRRIEKQIVILPGTSDPANTTLIQAQMEQLVGKQRALIDRFAEIDEKSRGTHSVTRETLLKLRRQIEAVQSSSGARPPATNIKELGSKLIAAQNQLLSELRSTPQTTPELSEAFIADFAKPFRSIRHLQKTLSDAPPILQENKGRITRELLKHIKEERALQIELESLSDDDLGVLIESYAHDYTKEQNKLADADHELLSQIQNLTHLATMIIVKRQCATCQARPNKSISPTEMYQRLMQNITALIPDVGASTVIDNVSDSRILINPNAQSAESITINRMLYDTRQALGLNNLAWNDPRQMALRLPSRHLSQRLRFGQEDRRIYADIRKTNLKSDLLTARNIYDINQFKDGVSDTALIENERKLYSKTIKSTVKKKARHPAPSTIYASFVKGLRDKYDESVALKKQRKEVPPSVQTSADKYIVFSSEYTLENLEKIFSGGVKALENIPCPEPLFSCDANGDITLELNYFTFDIEDQTTLKKNPAITGSGIATRVLEYISHKAPKEVLKKVYPQYDLRSIKKLIEDDENITEQTRTHLLKELANNGINAVKGHLKNTALSDKACAKMREISSKPELDLDLAETINNYIQDLPKKALPDSERSKITQKLREQDGANTLEAYINSSTIKNTETRKQLLEICSKHTAIIQTIQTAINTATTIPKSRRSQMIDALTTHGSSGLRAYIDRTLQNSAPSNRLLNEIKQTQLAMKEHHLHMLRQKIQHDRSHHDARAREQLLTRIELSDIDAILVEIEYDSSLTQEQRNAFSHKIRQSLPVRPPYESMAELSIDDNAVEIRLRKLLELKSFFEHYREYLTTHEGDTSELRRHVAHFEDTFKLIDSGEYKRVSQNKALDLLINHTYAWISTLTNTQLPESCHATRDKSSGVADSAEERTKTSQALDAALAQDKPENKKRAIHQVFLAEYGPQSQIAKRALGREQSAAALRDIEAMAVEYVDFAEKTENGKFSISEDQEDIYQLALHQVANGIADYEAQYGKLTGYQFKLSHKIPAGQNTLAEIKDENGNQIFQILINIAKKLPYSLEKSPHSDELLLSYGGSRGTVAEIPGSQKTRYFTGWRIYGVGQYGTVKRQDNFTTGEGSILKEGLVAIPGQTSTVRVELRQDPLTRNATMRDDPNSGTERTVLEAIAIANQDSDPSVTAKTEYWTFTGKPKAMYTRDATVTRYKMRQSLAKGMSDKDATNTHLNDHGKGEIAFHRPPVSEGNQALEDALAKATAISEKLKEYRAKGFSHNDLKPENIMVFRRANGSFAVEFIDWATGGFSLPYKTATPKEIAHPVALFQKLFGHDVAPKQNTADPALWTGPKGIFLRIERGQAIYGIDPKLEILHGTGRNCTLPYINPNVVLGRDAEGRFARESSSSTKTQHDLDTQLSPGKAERMDNYALTVLTSGLTNRQGYFKLAGGRAVNDYTVPNAIITQDGALAIDDPATFNEFFAPEKADRLAADLSNQDNPNAAMYTPSTLREGQPMHLYWLLKGLSSQTQDSDIRRRIKVVLKTFRDSITAGEGLSIEKLEEQVAIATQCLQDIEQTKANQETKQKEAVLQQALHLCNPTTAAGIESLLHPYDRSSPHSPKNIEILCTYPTPETTQQVVELLHQIPPKWLQDHILRQGAPVRSLLQLAITHHQPGILQTLLQTLRPNQALHGLIKEQGLLHYALQEGMTDSVQAIIDALMDNSDPTHPGLTQEAIFELMLQSYGPDADVTCPDITWNTNALHTAIRNNNREQLELILSYMPEEFQPTVRTAIEQGLYFSADLLNEGPFSTLLTTYNQKYPDHTITYQDILGIHDPEDVSRSCPLHFLLSESETHEQSISMEILDALVNDASNSRSPIAIQSFLKNHPYPSVIAAANYNFVGLKKLLALAKAPNLLTEEENQALLQQSDLNGANLLNHILRANDPTLLESFLSHPGMNPTILNTLLRNPDPNNPLRQFLSSHAARQDPTYATQTLITLLRGLGPNPENQDSQRPVRNILVANREWLINTANDPQNQKNLNDLLGEAWWSMAAKNSLLSKLLEVAKAGTVAHSFFSLKLNSFTPTKDSRKTVALDINRQDSTDIDSQRGDFRTLIEGLLANSGARYKEMSEASQTKILELEGLNTELRKQIELLSSGYENSQLTLESSVKSVAAAANEKSALQQKINDLEQQIKKEKITYRTGLDNLRKTHAQETGELEHQRDELRREHESLLAELNAKLESLKDQVSEKDLKIRELEARIRELSALQKKTEKDLEQLKVELAEISSQLGDQAVLEIESIELKTKLDNVNAELKSISVRAGQLVGEIEAKDQALISLKEDLTQSADEERAHLNKEISRLKQELIESGEAVSSITLQLEDTGARFKLLTDQYGSLTLQNVQKMKSSVH